MPPSSHGIKSGFNGIDGPRGLNDIKRLEKTKSGKVFLCGGNRGVAASTWADRAAVGRSDGLSSRFDSNNETRRPCAAAWSAGDSLLAASRYSIISIWRSVP